MVFGSKKVEDVEKSKIVKQGVSEGGVHVCTTKACADDPFITNDKKEWAEHLKQKGHYEQGYAPCAVCGNEVDMNVILTRAGNKPLHPECQQPVEEL